MPVAVARAGPSRSDANREKGTACPRFMMLACDCARGPITGGTPAGTASRFRALAIAQRGRLQGGRTRPASCSWNL